MTSTDASRESLLYVLRNPALIVAELAWRWAFAMGAIGILLSYSSILRDAISLSAAEQNALFSGNPVTMVAVGSSVLIGAMPYLIRVLVGAAPKIALLWWLCATVGRAPILRHAMFATMRKPAASGRKLVAGMAVVHFVRVIVLLIVLIAYLAGGRASGLVMGRPEDPNIILMVVVFTAVFAMGAVVWALANLVASNGALFVAAGESGGLDAIVLGLQFTVREYRRLWALAAVNASLRTLAGVVITIAGLLVVALAKFVPTAVIVGLLVVLTVAYCVLSDVLLLARSVAYLQLAFEPAALDASATNHESALYTAPPDKRK